MDKHHDIYPNEVPAKLQHDEDGVAWWAVAGFVEGDDAVFPFLAASHSFQKGFLPKSVASAEAIIRVAGSRIIRCTVPVIVVLYNGAT